MDRKASKKYKIVKAILMNFAPIALAIYLEIVGPTLPDLIYKLGVDYEKIARSLVARSVGYFISSLSAGFITDLLPRHLELLLAFFLTLGAVSTALAPFSTELWLLSLLFHLQGLAQGSLDTFNNSLCARMWGKRASVPLHGLHLGFGIGAFIAPQIARPFISDISAHGIRNNTNASFTYSEQNSSFSSENYKFVFNDTAPTPAEEWKSSVHVPYLISGVISGTFALIYLFFYIYEKTSHVTTDASVAPKPEAENDEKETKIALKETSIEVEEKSEGEKKRISGKSVLKIINPGTCTGGDTMFGIQVFVLVFLYYINIVGGERIYSKFIYSYALKSDNKMGRDKAALVNTLFWVFFTIGRVVAVVLAKFVRTRNYIIANLTFNIISGVCLSIWGFDEAVVLYVFSSLLGLVLSPLFPNCMAWINLYVELKGMAVALVFTGGAFGGIIYQYLGGFMFQYHGPQTMMYIILAYAIILSSVYGLMLLLVRKRPSRFQSVAAKNG